jgi:hypothetical protein
MLNFFRGDGEGPHLISGTLKVALALGALAYLASHSFSDKPFDYSGLSRLAADVTRKLPDPGMTGSLAQSARSTRLDPCVAPRRS